MSMTPTTTTLSGTPDIPRQNITAAFPPSARAGGAAMPPVTIEHVLALAAMRSPVVCGGKVRVADMMLAVAVIMADPDSVAGLVARCHTPDDLRALGMPVPAETETDARNAALELRRMAHALGAKVPLSSVPDLFVALSAQVGLAEATFVPMVPAGEAGQVPLGREGGEAPAGAGPSS